MVILYQINSATILSLPLPLMLFLWGILSNPIVTVQLLKKVTQWKISYQESSSDHNIIKFSIGQDDSCRENISTQNEVRYLTKKENHLIFRNNLKKLAKETLCRRHDTEATEDLDTMLSIKIVEATDIKKSIEELHGIIKKACDSAYKTQCTSKKKQQHTNQYHGGQTN
jgi:hypothetical protein